MLKWFLIVYLALSVPAWLFALALCKVSSGADEDTARIFAEMEVEKKRDKE